MLHVVITTIARPTACVNRLAKKLSELGGRLVVAGDVKGPDAFPVKDLSAEQLAFLSIEDQRRSEFLLAERLPTRHYCRKNLGYLLAIRDGATCIYETDDDNAPNAHWSLREDWIANPRFPITPPSQERTWVNAYRGFTDSLIWPRGFPLDQIHRLPVLQESAPQSVQSMNTSGLFWAPIQQGLVDGSPDVDAVWRLVLDREFSFDDAPSVMLAPRQWCPFNTQSTWWWPAVYPLLYIPSNCSFRMCDIWKSFIAQRCLWELGTGVVFHRSEVVQERNPHRLIQDFEDEVPGYLQNERLVGALEEISLSGGIENVPHNLHRCYESLVRAEIFPHAEMPLVEAWLDDVESVSKTKPLVAPLSMETPVTETPANM